MGYENDQKCEFLSECDSKKTGMHSSLLSEVIIWICNEKTNICELWLKCNNKGS